MGTDTAGLNGRFLGDSTDLVRFFRDATGGNDGKFTVPLEELAKLYVKYGKRFGIRADMAWAQMIHETGYGQYGGDVNPEQNNMAGIGATGGGVPGNSFATAELGVIAQYAHLAWYLVSRPRLRSLLRAGGAAGRRSHHRRRATRATSCKRRAAVHKGNVRTVYDLSGKWAPGGTYGSAVQTVASRIQVTCGLW